MSKLEPKVDALGDLKSGVAANTVAISEMRPQLAGLNDLKNRGLGALAVASAAGAALTFVVRWGLEHLGLGHQ